MKDMKWNKLLLLLVTVITIASAGAGQTADNSIAGRQQQMMAIMMAKPKLPVKTIGILLYDGYQTLDAMGPYETLGNLPGVKVFFIAKNRGTVKNQRGMRVQADTSMTEVRKLDILVIPGGAAETFKQTLDTGLLKWIRQIDKTTVYTTSVCTGAWILGASGLLNGKNATTNWYRAGEMLKKYGAQFKNERWVQDGKYWTSAGVTAGIDMSLAIINELMGEQYTQAAMLNLEYNPHPPVKGGTPEMSDPIVAEMMLEMYDAGMLPIINKSTIKIDTTAPVKKQVAPVNKQAVPGTAVQPAKTDTLEQDGIDPVCHMKVYKGNNKTAVYQGKKYGFCSDMCRSRFLKDPGSFIH